MKSAKVVNKILLISLAFGSITFVAGILAEGNLKKTLMGLGATTSVASIAGTLLTKDKDKSNEENDVQSENTPAVEPSAQKQADYSADEGDRMMQAVEADVNPLQTEEAQTLEFVSNLNSQKEELEAQHDSNEPEIVEELEVENSDRDFEVDELTSKNEELEESLSPIDESFTNINAEETPEKFDDEPFTAQNYPTETNNVVDNVEEDINPFVSSSELSENEPEEAPNTEIADKLFGAFDPAISETDDELLIEEDSEEVGFEAASMAESELPIQELAMEDNSTDEFDFDDDSAIASESESESSMEELIMEDDSSDEFNFGEELATSTETEESNFDNDLAIESESGDEFNFGDDLAIASEPESIELESSMDDLVMEDDSSDEFDFGNNSATSTESELELDSPIEETESSVEELSFDNDLAVESESGDEFNFNDDSAIASESELESSMDDLVMEDDSNDEFDFDNDSATYTESELDSPIEETESSVEELSFEDDLAIASESESPMEELVMEDDSTDEFNFGEELATLTETEESSFGNDLAVESESVESPESNLDSVDELSFEAMPMAESKSQDDFMGEFVDEDKSSEEFSLEETSEEDSVVGDIVESLMVEDELSFNEPGLEESSVTDDNIFGDLDLDSKSDESNEFIKELLEHNESAPNELSFESDMVTTSDSESDELSFEDFSAPEATSDDLFESLPDNESEVEFNLEETSEEDSNFDDLMSVFAEDDSDDNLDGFDLKFEDEDLDTINSLDAVDKKLDELSEISEDSLGELNDLLSSIQNDDPAEEKKADEVHQEQ